ALAFHDGQSGLGPDVAEAQDARPVRYDGDLIPLVRQGPHLARVRGDVEAGLRDPRGVPDREVVEAADGHPRDDLDLALVERVVLRGLFLRKVRSLQVLFDFLGSRRFHAFVAPALFRGHHGSTKRGREESSGRAYTFAPSNHAMREETAFSRTKADIHLRLTRPHARRRT